MDRARVEFLTRDGLACTVREAVPEDAQALLALRDAVLAERLDGVISQPEDPPLTLEQERAWIAGYAGADNSVLLVAEHEGRIAGLLDLRGGRRLRERHAATFGITVAREWRNRGVGTALVRAMLDWATANPAIDKVKLSVVAQNEDARRLYRRLGFEEEGTQRREYKKADGTYLDNVLMCRFVKEMAEES